MITLNNVQLCYKRNKPVLKGVDLEIKPGNIYGLLGKNGEGKTTLLKILSGQLFPDKGTCLLSGEKVSQRKAEILRQLFILPEELSMPDVTAMQYIKMYAPFYPTFNDTILKACFESFEMDFSSRIQKMSLGQKKKVAITLALAAHTPVLLMDEPTNGLDIPSKAVFRKLLASFTNESQTIIISTHQVRDLESLIDSVIILENKQILLNNRLDEIGNRLFFRTVSPTEKVLYSETTPSGLIGVGENLNSEETPISLELLFNAAILHPGEMKRIFNL